MSASETFPVDENGLRVRLGRDPKMVMEAEGDPVAPAPEAAPVEAALAVETPVIEAAPVVEAEAPKTNEDKWDTDTRKYIEDLRGENAKYRTRAQKFETAFEGLDGDTMEGMLGLVAALKNGDPAAAPVLESILADLTPAQQEALAEAVDEGEPKFKTQEELDAYLEERDAKKEADRVAEDNFKAMKTEVESLGYDLSPENTNPETSLLFFFLGQQPQDQAPDIQAAHKKVEELFDSRIQAFKEGVNEKASRFARIAVAGATPNGADGGKKKLRVEDGSAGKAALEYMQSGS